MNDAEIIWLKNYSFGSKRYSYPPEYKKFFEVHKSILQPFNPNEIYHPNKEPQEHIMKKTLEKSYLNNLLSLGLLDEKFKAKKDKEAFDIDMETGKIRVSHYYCSKLGFLLLKYIDMEN